jgi:hypothetical protein
MGGVSATRAPPFLENDVSQRRYLLDSLFCAKDTIPPVKGVGIHWGTGHPTNNKSESLAISVLI